MRLYEFEMDVLQLCNPAWPHSSPAPYISDWADNVEGCCMWIDAALFKFELDRGGREIWDQAWWRKICLESIQRRFRCKCSQIYPLLDNARNSRLHTHTKKLVVLVRLEQHSHCIRPFFGDSDIDLNLFNIAALHLWDVWQTVDFFFKDNFCVVALILDVCNS